jgi:hypothetical protein
MFAKSGDVFHKNMAYSTYNSGIPFDKFVDYQRWLAFCLEMATTLNIGVHDPGRVSGKGLINFV